MATAIITASDACATLAADGFYGSAFYHYLSCGNSITLELARIAARPDARGIVCSLCCQFAVPVYHHGASRIRQDGWIMRCIGLDCIVIALQHQCGGMVAADLDGCSSTARVDGNTFQYHIQQAVEAIKTKSIALAKKDIDTLIIMGDKKIHPLLDRYKEDEQRHLLVIMSRFDFISYDILEDIFEERIKEVLETIFDMMVFGIVSTFGPSDRFFRLDHYLSDYIKRNHFSLPKDLELHINDILEKNIDESTDITKDTSLYLYEIKRKIMAGHGNTNSYLIPSIIIKSIMDIYYKRDYNHVIEICDKVLNDNHNFYSETTRELKYWLCLALCRTQNEQRFYDEVKSIEGADYWFLRGFYQRIATDYAMAEKSFRKSLNLAPSMQRAKRELVTVLLALHHYPEALSLAKENFERDSDNTYHIHAYFRCLVKKVNCDREDIDTLKNLLNNMQNSYSDKKDELYTAMNIEYQAYIKRKEPNVILEFTTVQ